MWRKQHYLVEHTGTFWKGNTGTFWLSSMNSWDGLRLFLLLRKMQKQLSILLREIIPRYGISISIDSAQCPAFSSQTAGWTRLQWPYQIDSCGMTSFPDWKISLNKTLLGWRHTKLNSSSRSIVWKNKSMTYQTQNRKTNQQVIPLTWDSTILSLILCICSAVKTSDHCDSTIHKFVVL